ncbi:MAG TPA: PLDc N-terminal domain-containing protein [Micromonosporaceae bacterium]|jgi:hypothetical protein|nr:PLDc N-terminal domain-containing protein [Micromonosporaceae bacterium]
MGGLLTLVLLIDLAVMVAAFYDCISTDPAAVRNLPKVVWVLVILLLTGIGGLIWFSAGRPVRTPGPIDSNHPAGRALRSELSADTEEMPRQSEMSGGPRRPIAPDDDPDFLRSLGEQTRRATEERLRRWEADLRLREERLREREDPPSESE